MNFCDHEHPLVQELCSKFLIASHGDEVAFVTEAFNWVRDEIRYCILTDWTVSVEYTIKHLRGNCGTKACLLGAILKAGGIDVRFALQKIDTSTEFFFVPEWVTGQCSKRSIHFNLVAFIGGKWIHLDATLDMSLASCFQPIIGDYLISRFDGTNHAVMGGHESFDPSRITVVPDIDRYMEKKTRLLGAFRDCFNLSFEFCRKKGHSFKTKKTLIKRLEEHLVRSHRDACKEIFRLLMKEEHTNKQAQRLVCLEIQNQPRCHETASST